MFSRSITRSTGGNFLRGRSTGQERLSDQDGVPSLGSANYFGSSPYLPVQGSSLPEQAPERAQSSTSLREPLLSRDEESGGRARETLAQSIPISQVGFPPPRPPRGSHSVERSSYRSEGLRDASLPSFGIPNVLSPATPASEDPARTSGGRASSGPDLQGGLLRALLKTPSLSKGSPVWDVKLEEGEEVLGLEADVEADGPATPPSAAAPARLPSEHRSVLPGSDEPVAAKGAGSQWNQTHVRGFTYGCINAVICVPVMISYAKIVFKGGSSHATHTFFDPYMADLVKMVYLASCIHQTVFALGSTLPFSVGQVQDVGLIFLSKMATTIVDDTVKIDPETGRPEKPMETLATVLMCTTLATAVTGLAIVLVGVLKLARYVQHLPVPVVGGYLGYVGYYCFAAGLSQATMTSISGFGTWPELFNADAAIKLVPAVLEAALLFLVSEHLRSPLALPLTMLAIPALFYVVLYGGHWSLELAQENHWVTPATETNAGWRCWEYMDFSLVQWGAVAKQAPTMAVLFFIVVFGSALDIAAIQAGAECLLDTDKELVTVGLSNLIAGLSGMGFTGSYIFSQTIFSQRQGVDSRVNGLIVVVVELALFLAPLNIVQYFPGFFFGGIMIFFGIDIMLDWLVRTFRKVSYVEYALVWVTFVLIMTTNLEEGMGLGVLAAALLFTVLYARQSTYAVLQAPKSAAVWAPDQEAALTELRADAITAIAFKGYVFFGSVMQIMEGVLPEISEKCRRQLQAAGGTEGLMPPQFVVLDFSKVGGLDATAAHTLGTLMRTLKSRGLNVVTTGVLPSMAGIRRLLSAHEIIAEAPPGAAASAGALTQGEEWVRDHAAGADEDAAGPRCLTVEFITLERGLDWCERKLLAHAVGSGACLPAPERITLGESLARALAGARDRGLVQLEDPALAEQVATISRHFEYREGLHAGEFLFRGGDASHDLFVVEAGSVEVFLEQGDELTNLHSAGARYGPGCILGDLDFFVQPPEGHHSSARVRLNSTAVHAMSLHSFRTLAADHPAASALFQTAMLWSMSNEGQANVKKVSRALAGSHPLGHHRAFATRPVPDKPQDPDATDDDRPLSPEIFSDM